MKKILIIIFSLAIALSSCQRRPRLVILHTNDTHSHFEPLRSGENAGAGGVIERAAILDSIRAAVGEDRLLLIHAGDFSQGTSYFTELHGQLEPKVINAMAYDCVCLGNHEFDNDIEALEQRIAQFTKTKVVAANLDLSQFTIAKYIQPYAIFEKAGFKIGIIGLSPDLNSYVKTTVSDRIVQFDSAEVTNKWASYLTEEQKCDFVIVLSHLGYEEDQKLVSKTSNVDFVVGGHTHKFLEDFCVVKDRDGKDVRIITDGCWGLELGQIDIY